MKKALKSLAKWSWFGLLTLLAFGYMASGLSDPDRPGESGSEKTTQVRLPIWDQSRQSGDTVEQTTSRRPDGTGPEAVSIAEQQSPELRDGENLSALSETRAETPADAGRDSLQAVVRAVDAARQSDLAALGLQAAASADWLTVCRRMSLALVGSGVSLEEIRELERIPESKREARHLENLLQDQRFHQYWAERWARFLVGADEGPFIVYRRRRFRYWLAEELAANRPYDQVVSKLITAGGLWTDRPEVNFLTVTFDSNDGNPDPIRLAARTSRAFLGLRIDCLQCHNDFLGNVNLGELPDVREGLQSDFHQLAAFYSSAKTFGLQGVRSESADYTYQYLDEDEETEVQPAVPFRADLLPEEGGVRQRLAVWTTHRENRQFSKAAVSRFWALMFGRAATEAVDNLPLDEPLPVVLDPIVDDFSRHRDVRRTIEIIVRSAPFRSASRADFEITPRHEQHHAVFPLTRLRGEQVAGAIVQASKIKSINRDSSLLIQLIRFGSINDFLERYGDLGENEFSTDGVTIPQRLLMLNGKMLREAGQPNPVLNTTGHINLFARGDAQAIDVMFLCVLNRYPGNEERAHFVERLSASDERAPAIEDLYWTLANSTEFAWNH